MFGYVRAVVHDGKDRSPLPTNLLHHPRQLRLVTLIRLENLVALAPCDLVVSDVHAVDKREREVLQPHGQGVLLVDADFENGVVGE